MQTADELAVAIAQPEWDLILTEWTLPVFRPGRISPTSRSGGGSPNHRRVRAWGEEDTVDALKAGAQDYVMKGQLARLVPSVEQALREDAERKAYKAMEEALRESEDRFRKLVQGSPLGIMFLDEQSRYIKVNQAFCHMVGTRKMS